MGFGMYFFSRISASRMANLRALLAASSNMQGFLGRGGGNFFNFPKVALTSELVILSSSGSNFGSQ